MEYMGYEGWIMVFYGGAVLAGMDGVDFTWYLFRVLIVPLPHMGGWVEEKQPERWIFSFKYINSELTEMVPLQRWQTATIYTRQWRMEC